MAPAQISRTGRKFGMRRRKWNNWRVLKPPMIRRLFLSARLGWNRDGLAHDSGSCSWRQCASIRRMYCIACRLRGYARDGWVLQRVRLVLGQTRWICWTRPRACIVDWGFCGQSFDCHGCLWVATESRLFGQFAE